MQIFYDKSSCGKAFADSTHQSTASPTIIPMAGNSGILDLFTLLFVSSFFPIHRISVKEESLTKLDEKQPENYFLFVEIKEES